MNKKEMENKISEKLREIWEIYHGAYPKGTYLTMFIINGYIHFNNDNYDKDILFSVDRFESLQESQE